MTDSHYPQQAADRNLLFGILAVQMDLIGRDDLIHGLNAWVLEKSKPLAQILEEQGKLTASDRALLEPLVARHLQVHDNNPQKSLAALGSASSLKHDLQQVDDPVILASLPVVGADRNDDPLQTVDRFTGTGERYRILRPHARGGLGEVFVAHDAELNREVALKAIQERHANQPDSRSRFVVEAEITGGLEHPGIVPVYGLGYYDDGRPFYAMRFIRGESLQEAIKQFHEADKPGRDPAERSLALRGLLRRFIDVCNAVDYAHSRGVLHRDLKPGNIMLGKYGETLVVDWGLAKSQVRRVPDISPGLPDDSVRTLVPTSGSEVSPTLPGSAIGTPAYMSPEQAAGRLAELGPASDVYGLGATLYHLLVGKPPFGGEHVATILGHVQHGDFVMPRAANASVSPALEAICLKAMALNPENRYHSPRDLANDLEHWLADEPVKAHVEPWTLQTRRWMRKHRALVTSAAASLVVLTIFSIAGAVLLGAAFKREEGLNSELAQKNTALAEKKKLADERFTMALDAVKTQVFDIQERLQNRPGTRDLREALLKSATERLKKLVEQAEQSRDADRTAAAAHLALGDVYQTIDGRPARAREAYEKGHDIHVRLAAADPSDVRAQRDLSVSLDRLGDVTLQAGQPAKASEYFTQSLDISRKLAADPSEAQTQRDLSVSLDRLGKVALQAGQAAKAVEYFTQSLDIGKKLAAANPSDAQAQRDLSVFLDRLGYMALQAGQPAKASEYFTQSLDISRKLAAADPSDAQAQRDLSVSLNWLGDMTRRGGQPAKALEYFTQSLDIDKKLAAADPSDARAQRDLSVSLDRLGDVTLQAGQPAKALEYFTQSLDISRKLAAADPSDAQAQRDLVVSQNKLGNLEKDQGNHDKALKWFEPSLALAQKLQKEGRWAAADRDYIKEVENRIAESRAALGAKKKGEKKD